MSVIHLSSLFLCDNAFVASCSFRFAFSVFATSVPFSSVLSLFAVIVNICAFLWLLHPCIRLRSPPASHHHSFPDPNFTRVLSCKISIFHSVCTPQFAPTSVFISSCFKYLKFFFFFNVFQFSYSLCWDLILYGSVCPYVHVLTRASF